MARRLSWLAATATACVVMTMGQSALAQEIPLVTGKQWTQSTEQMKKAYLVGIANLAQVESAYYADKPPGDTQSIMPRLSKGLRAIRSIPCVNVWITGMRRTPTSFRGR
jgi:hypothetical protein